MSSHPPGEVSNRRKAAAIRLLSATVDDESAALYLRVQAARSLLQVKPPAKPDDDEAEPIASPTQKIVTIDGREFVEIGDGPKVVILPFNRRKFIVEDRERARLEQLAETQIADADEPAFEPPPPAAEPVKHVAPGKALLRQLRARRRALRA